MAGSSSDVVIVGGGVIGCAIAYALTREGAGVTVLERGSVGGESSRAAAGILAPRVHAAKGALFPLALASHARFGALAEALRAETGLDAEYVRSGVLDLAHDEPAAEALRDKVRWLREAGHDVDWLEPAQVVAMEPALKPDIRGAFYDADAYHIHPGRFTQALAQAAGRRGARFELGVDVVGLKRHGARVEAVRTATGEVPAGLVVLATGAWASFCGEWMGVPIPVYPAKGQILTVYALPPPIRAVIFGLGAYLLPRVDGTIVVGATVERVGFDKTLTASALAWLLGVIPSLCPGLADAPLHRAWAGLRPGSADDLPIVGVVPSWENVILATGHYRNGIMLAPITADLVADLIVREKADDLLAPLAPSRFMKSQPDAP